MKMHLYASYDRVSGIYGTLRCEAVEPETFRASMIAAARKGGIGHDLDDIEVHEVGTFENHDGIVEGMKPNFVLRFSELSLISDTYKQKAKKAEELANAEAGAASDDD